MKMNVWVVALTMMFLLLLLPFLTVSHEHQESSYDVPRSDIISSVTSYGDDDNFIDLVLNSGLGVGPYDQMQVVYTWIPSYCRVHRGTTERCKSSFEKEEGFSVHGLWPADENGETLQPKGPCRHPADISKLPKTLKSKLLQAMPAIGHSWSDTAFWESQWVKHGCLQNVVAVEPYFEAAYNQWSTTDLLTYLRDNGITPGDTGYTRGDIEDAIMNGIGGTPQTKILISCKTVPVGGGRFDKLLYEIYVCLDKNAKRKVSCKNMPGDTKGCGSGTNIKLPPNLI